MGQIRNIHARQILDSRGNPTLEVDIYLGDNSFGRAAVPSGASTGEHEAVELRDNNTAYCGKSVNQAVENVNQIIAGKLVGMDAFDIKSIDATMLALDGTENKARLGANAILGVSMATVHAAAVSSGENLLLITKNNEPRKNSNSSCYLWHEHRWNRKLVNELTQIY